MTAPYEPLTLTEAIRYYSEELICIDLLASIRWPEGKVFCSRRGEVGNAIWLANQKRWKCRGCKKQFSIKVGTIFEDSPIGLDKWMVAVWMLANCRNGVSSYEIMRCHRQALHSFRKDANVINLFKIITYYFDYFNLRRYKG
ncbi:MAG TPA: transposase [Terracidiphilus sp.]|nr:transposase [Terracidiphilus sp.]